MEEGIGVHTHRCFRSDGDWFCSPGCTHDADERRATEIATLHAENARLRAALKPFAEAAVHLYMSSPDTDAVNLEETRTPIDDWGSRGAVTVGDLRRAAEREAKWRERMPRCNYDGFGKPCGNTATRRGPAEWLYTCDSCNPDGFGEELPWADLVREE